MLRDLRVLVLYAWRRLGQIARSSTWGYCLRCARPWGGKGKTKYHETWLKRRLAGTSGLRGLYPLCEDCFAELGTTERRLPFYRRLQRKWVKQGASPDLTQWAQIEQAVRDEA